eukprot:365443-Chlamydomonas_euryale.AAC.7
MPPAWSRVNKRRSGRGAQPHTCRKKYYTEMTVSVRAYTRASMRNALGLGADSGWKREREREGRRVT